MNENPKSRLILVAEDNDTDFFLLEKAFSQHREKVPLARVSDGSEAVDYLAGNNGYGDRSKFPMPDLLLLDLKMPRKGGMEVLEWIRSQPSLKSLVVVILSSSSYEEEVRHAYELGANTYFVKPGKFFDFVELTRILLAYWLQWSRLPSTAAGKPNGILAG